MTATHTRRLVLVADTDPSFGEDTRQLIADDRVLSARSIEDAAEIVVGGRVDLVLLGPSFGNEAGVGSAALLREADPGVAVVLAANIVTNRILLAALRSGVADVIDMPLTVRKLSGILERVPARQGVSGTVVLETPADLADERVLTTQPGFEPVTITFEGSSSLSTPVTFVQEDEPPAAVPPMPAPAPDPVQPPVPDAWAIPITAAEPEPAASPDPLPSPSPERPPVEPMPPVDFGYTDPLPPPVIEGRSAPPSVMEPTRPGDAAVPPVDPAPRREPPQFLPPPPPPPFDPPPLPKAAGDSTPKRRLPVDLERVGLLPADGPLREHRSTTGHVVAVMAGKGGSGKTITATNLAMALTMQRGEDSVVLVDSDLQFGDVALLLQLEPTRTLVEAVAHLDELSDARLDGMLLRHESGLRVLAAPLHPASASDVPAKAIVEVVERLRGMYEVIVIDTPPIFDDHLVTVLEGADEVLVVVDMDLPSVKNAKIALEALRSGRFPMERVRLVVNRANAKARLDLVELERSLGLRVAGSIPSDRLIPQSVNEGIPVVALSPRSRVARAFHTLAALIHLPEPTGRRR
jgi:MinD-like ATPase involved in chromosome partitioning or flagellar assembly